MEGKPLPLILAFQCPAASPRQQFINFNVCALFLQDSEKIQQLPIRILGAVLILASDQQVGNLL